MADLVIPQQILDDMIAHARELAPHECCGLLAGTGSSVTKMYRIKNVVALEGVEHAATFDAAKIAHLERLSPEDRAEIAFAMDMRDLAMAQKDMRRNGLNLHVVYHSPPISPARPSVTDIANAREYEDLWEKINLAVPAYLLISLMNPTPDVKNYWIKAGLVSPAPFIVR